jgi:hypothetical protein
MFETPGADDFDDLGAEEVDLDRDVESNRDSDFDADGSADDELDLAEGESPKAKSAAHRSIPSWSEAIGMIVASNMASHSQRRTSGGNGGASRGRPRGGRRRGGGGRRGGGPVS